MLAGRRGWGQTRNERGVYEPAFLTSASLERPTEESQGFKPDLGNPAVRDYRGAAGTVSHGGNVNPSCNRKSRNGNPPPKAGRARVLSQRHESESRIQAKADLKPPACRSPEGRVSIVRWNPKGMRVCPAKAGVFSGRQSHQGKSQEPCSLDSQEEGN